MSSYRGQNKSLCCFYTTLVRCGAELMAAAAEGGTDDEVMWTSRIVRLKV